MILPIDIIEWVVVLASILFVLIIAIVLGQFVRALLSGRLSALDLINDPDGRYSESKMWTQVGKGMAVYVMIKDAADG